ncbi:MAG: hypothetical protein NZL89_06765, partial [Leptospiraceae bacterium]|nr:hypothetical protein [Leptospiraceae bacterium]
MQLSLAQRIAFGGLCLMAAGLSFSISIAQLGLGIALLAFLAGFFAKSMLREKLAGAFGLKVLYVFFVLWALWRLFHVVISPTPLAELREAREVWLMLIPLFIW